MNLRWSVWNYGRTICGMKGTLEMTTFPSRATLIPSVHIISVLTSVWAEWIILKPCHLSQPTKGIFFTGGRMVRDSCIFMTTIVSDSEPSFTPVGIIGRIQTLVSYWRRTSYGGSQDFSNHACHQNLLHGHHQLPKNIDLWTMSKSTRLVGTAVSIDWLHIQGVLLNLHR